MPDSHLSVLWPGVGRVQQHFFSSNALASGVGFFVCFFFFWIKWLRPCYALIDLCPSTWNSEHCLTQNPLCHWEGDTTHTCALECFFTLSCQVELPAWTMLCHCCILLEQHALPSDGTSSSPNCNCTSYPALVLSSQEEAPLSWPWNSPTCPILLKDLIMPRRTQTKSISTL